MNVVELNTVSNPSPAFRDETERIFCSKCGNWLRLGNGMMPDPTVMAITSKHLELCEGDAAVTLWRIDQWWKFRAFAPQSTQLPLR